MNMTENELYKSARAMASMGSFAASIGEAFFVADTENRETLVQAFKGLFERALEVAEPNALAEAGRAIVAGCEFYEKWQKTRAYMLDVISADGPCTLNHVWHDCKFQGITTGFSVALSSLKNAGLVVTECEDGETIVSLV
jgi:hypothetical protein